MPLLLRFQRKRDGGTERVSFRRFGFWGALRNGLTGQSPMEQLAAGHLSPFNDGQGAFAQFDPSKARASTWAGGERSDEGPEGSSKRLSVDFSGRIHP